MLMQLEKRESLHHQMTATWQNSVAAYRPPMQTANVLLNNCILLLLNQQSINFCKPHKICDYTKCNYTAITRNTQPTQYDLQHIMPQ